MSRPLGNVYAFPHARDLPRRPLWELPAGLHCQAIGLGLPIGELRSALNALFGGTSTACDYELHAAVVRECATRNKVSEMLQEALDRRHAAAIERFAGASSGHALAARWDEAAEEGDVAGALWAVIGHPHCDVELAEHVARETHMRQHGALGELREARIEGATLAAENRLLKARLSEPARGSPAAPAARRRGWRLGRLWRIERPSAAR